MNNNAQYLYQSLLSSADEEARQDYNVDPRVQMYQTRNLEQNVNPYTGIPSAQLPEFEQNDEDLAPPVQDAPETTEKTSIVIIDTANRDWVKQPNAYSFVFSFGASLPTSQQSALQVPYYYNNALVPFAAYDMPLNANSNLGSSSLINVQQLPNNTPRIIPGTSIPVPAPVGTPGTGATLGQTYGWRLVVDTSGNLKHADPFNPNNILPSDQIIYFPVYNPRESRGATIGIDTIFQLITGGDLGFSTQLKVTNVTSLKLARATIPIRKFDPYSPTEIASSWLNALHTEPYLLMYVENLKGIYYGSTSNIQNAFTALVQQQRRPLDITVPGVLIQFQDYYPWSKEAFEFTPPVAQLSNAVISLADNNGNFLSHTDDLNLIMIRISPDRSDVSNGFGTLTFYITRDIAATTYPDTSNLTNYFSLNELRTGDELEFYAPVISQILNDPQTDTITSNFFNYVYNQGVFVTSVQRVDLSGSYPLLNMGYSVNAVIKTTDFSNTLAVYSNLSELVSLTSTYNIPNTIVLRQITDLSSLDPAINVPRYSNVPSSFEGNYPLPILNINMQSTFTFEVVSAEPNVAILGKIPAT
uniref:Uncharacterized protein n=1 Tax=viral metagenome TaxID=1070528 RepID=A0A6C0I5Q4_9ZZZZ